MQSMFLSKWSVKLDDESETCVSKVTVRTPFPRFYKHIHALLIKFEFDINTENSWTILLALTVCSFILKLRTDSKMNRKPESYKPLH